MNSMRIYKSKAEIRKLVRAPEVFSDLNSKAECGECNLLFESMNALVDHVWAKHNQIK